MTLGSPLPQISISPAPYEEQVPEPFSPFDSSFTSVKESPESYRAAHLTPPPTASNFPKPLSPLRPIESVTENIGMQRERFEALLKASRARQAAIPAKKDTGLLREIALKAHKNKQIERRALFLSKVLAPPSPTATSTPKTPPESPAIFHYSLPSPGMSSPLSLFETLDELDDDATKDCRVEQVDFKPVGSAAQRVPSIKLTHVAKAARPLPSLDQITAHIHGRAANTATTTSRLPAFLKAPKRLPSPPAGDRPRLTTGVGRLSMPIRAPAPVKAEGPMLPPVTPTSPLTPKLQITTTLVPRTTASSPIQLTESNLLSFNSREQRSKSMLSAIRKRHSGVQDPVKVSENMQRSQMLAKRKSAPSDLASARIAVWGAAPASGGFF